MYTKLKTYNENILVPRNLDTRQDKLKQEAIKLLSQEIIDGDFKLEFYMLDIPEELIKVKTINGYFSCTNLNLIKLPKWLERLTVNGGVYCYDNQLTSLEHCPQTINGSFDCSNNLLTSLEFCPKTINGYFSCSDNQLTSLQYCPQIVNADFYCQHNKVKLQRPENCKIKGEFINII